MFLTISPNDGSHCITDETPASQGLRRVRQTALSHPHLQPQQTPTLHVRSYGARRLPGGIPEAEITHILGHYDLSKARNILWKARRNQPAPVWVAAADDDTHCQDGCVLPSWRRR